MRGDQDSDPGRVHEMNRHQPPAGKLLGPSPDAAEMASIANGSAAQAVLPCPLGCEVHSLASDHLAVAEPALNDQQRPPVANDLGMAVRQEMPGAHPIDIFADPDYPM